MKRSFPFAVLFCCAVPALAFAQTKLEHKFTPGEKHNVRVEVTVDQTLTVSGMEFPSKVQQFFQLESVVGEADSTGDFKVKQKFKSLQAFIDLPDGTEFRFDSASPPDDDGESAISKIMTPMYKTLAGSTFFYVHDKRGNVIDAGREKRENEPTIDESIADVLAPSYWRQLREQELNRLPDKAVSIGDTWKRKSVSEFGGGQSMTFEIEYTYDGAVKQDGKTLHRITGKYKTVTYKLTPGKTQPASVTRSDLKIKDSAVTLLFDADAGDVVSSLEKVHIVGDLVFEVPNGDQKLELPGKLDLSIETKTKVE